MILQTYSSALKCAKNQAYFFKFTSGNQIIPVIVPHFGTHHIYAIQEKVKLPVQRSDYSSMFMNFSIWVAVVVQKFAFRGRCSHI